MASLIFAQAKSIRNKCYKAAQQHAQNAETFGMNYKEAFHQCYETNLKVHRNEFKEILKIASQLHEDYLEITGKTTKQWYFITIRPDENKITFEEFYNKVMKFTNRKCIVDCSSSFEQKGSNIENIGKGFHVHIIANGTWRSKGECLRDTQSTFISCTAPNCIQVIPTNEPEKIKQNYLIEYKSDDDHKIVTKEMDAQWRLQNNINEIYEGPLPPRASPVSAPVSSPEQAQIVGTFLKENITITFE